MKVCQLLHMLIYLFSRGHTRNKKRSLILFPLSTSAASACIVPFLNQSSLVFYHRQGKKPQNPNQHNHFLVPNIHTFAASNVHQQIRM